MAEKYLSKDQVRRVLDQLPPGASKEQALQGLVSKGFTLEGLNDSKSKSASKTTKQPEKKGSFFGDLGRAIIKPVLDTAATGYRAAQATGRLLQGEGTAAARDLEKPIDLGFLGRGEVRKIGEDVGSGKAPFSLATTGRTLGTGIELGSTFAGGGAGAGLARGAATQSIKQLAKTGARQGLKIGAAGGLGSGLSQENANLGSIALSTGLGAAAGGGIGALTGAISPLLTKAGRQSIAPRIASRQSANAEKNVLEAIAPELNKKVRLEALQQGRITEPTGLFGKQDVLPTRAAQTLTERLTGKINPAKQTGLQVYNTLKKEIGSISEDVIAPMIEKHNPIFNKKTINATLRDIEKPITIKSDATMSSVFDSVRGKAMSFVDKNSKDLKGLLQARKDFDAFIKSESKRAFSPDSSTALSTAAKEIRSEMNQFIAKQLDKANPGAGERFLDELNAQHMIYNVLEEIENKVQKEAGTTNVKRILLKHPDLKKALTWALSAAGFGFLGSQLGD